MTSGKDGIGWIVYSSLGNGSMGEGFLKFVAVSIVVISFSASIAAIDDVGSYGRGSSHVRLVHLCFVTSVLHYASDCFLTCYSYRSYEGAEVAGHANITSAEPCG